jgi:hypothetical protein
MDNFLLMGSALGALLGLLHGVYLFRQIAVRPPADGIPGGKAQGLYYALWAFVLWILFGSYVLAFWILGLLAYPIVRLVQRQRVA